MLEKYLVILEKPSDLPSNFRSKLQNGLEVDGHLSELQTAASDDALSITASLHLTLATLPALGLHKSMLRGFGILFPKPWV
jgi:hypothetical protein